MAILHGVRRRVFIVSLIGLALLAGLTAVSWLGSLYASTDILSHFRLHYAAGLALITLFMVAAGRWRFALTAVFLASLNAGSALYYAHKPLVAASSGKSLKVITLNTLYWAQNGEKIVRFLRKESPDIIFFQELPAEKLSILHRLKKDYPWQAHCAHQEGCELAVVSRHAWQESAVGFRTPGKARYIWARFGADYANMTVADVHLKWPYFSNQKADLEEIYRRLPKTRGPLLIAGDFNAAPWSWALSSFMAAKRLWPAGPFRPTWPDQKFSRDVFCGLCIPQLPIDHIIVSDDVRVLNSRTGPNVGSDHLPLIVDLTVPRQTVAQNRRPVTTR